MAEKANPKSQPRKGQPSARRRTQVAVPHARPAREAPVPTRPVRGPAVHRALPAAPSGAARSRAPASTPHVPRAQDTPGPAPGDPGDSPEPGQHRVRVARLTEAGLRQLGRISSSERILEWLDSTLASGAEAMAELQGELHEELEGDWESEQHESS